MPSIHRADVAPLNITNNEPSITNEYSTLSSVTLSQFENETNYSRTSFGTFHRDSADAVLHSSLAQSEVAPTPSIDAQSRWDTIDVRPTVNQHASETNRNLAADNQSRWDSIDTNSSITQHQSHMTHVHPVVSENQSNSMVRHIVISRCPSRQTFTHPTGVIQHGSETIYVQSLASQNGTDTVSQYPMTSQCRSSQLFISPASKHLRGGTIHIPTYVKAVSDMPVYGSTIIQQTIPEQVYILEAPLN
jgi:hypothetical protein